MALLTSVVLISASVWIAGCSGGAQALPTGTPYEAASLGNSASLEGALKEGFDVNQPDENGMTLLHHAAEANQPKVIELLVRVYGADLGAVDSEERTPRKLAVIAGAKKAVKAIDELRAAQSPL